LPACLEIIDLLWRNARNGAGESVRARISFKKINQLLVFQPRFPPSGGVASLPETGESVYDSTFSHTVAIVINSPEPSNSAMHAVGYAPIADCSEKLR
jgi:hypothetical protein